MGVAEQAAALPGVQLLTPTFFNEFTLRLPRAAAPAVDALAARGVLAGVPASRLWPSAGLDNLLIVAVTELNTDEDAAALIAGLREVLR